MERRFGGIPCTVADDRQQGNDGVLAGWWTRAFLEHLAEKALECKTPDRDGGRLHRLVLERVFPLPIAEAKCAFYCYSKSGSISHHLLCNEITFERGI